MFFCDFCKNFWENPFRSSRLEVFCKKGLACKFIKNETLAQVFSCEICEIFQNTFFYRALPMAASVFWQNTFEWLLLVFSREFWEVIQNTSFIEHF